MAEGHNMAEGPEREAALSHLSMELSKFIKAGMVKNQRSEELYAKNKDKSWPQEDRNEDRRLGEAAQGELTALRNQVYATVGPDTHLAHLKITEEAKRKENSWALY